ncbi:hypothetical protein SAMN05444411_102462 [Lutibacter oricola]|uniref:Uncharacterized protein n=1 Tax=Lutibacter oricola TaxID=762486 RepID=A0A1H2XGE8_9FLAO|nr:hypothetical protein [Lutibacter oricola]SDW91983.1 hypothetical protein SAMN05444411_102462 [Lutibacter oricola]
MQKKRFYLLFFGLLILCTSCFEIVEEVSFNKDGSGHITLTVNLSKSRTKINSIMLLDSVNNYKVPSKITINNKIASIVQEIKKTKGISNVKNSSNFNEYIFTISCDFTNVEALNTVISNFSSKKDAALIKQQQHFSFNKSDNIFARNYHYNLSKEFGKTKMEDRKVFETASLTTIYRFETPIISSKNIEAKISGNKKAIMLRVNAQDIIKNKKSIKNQIQLQK